MDKSDLLLCTDNDGQPLCNEHGKLIYYCKKTGALTILNDEPHTSHEASLNENTNEIEKDATQSAEPRIKEKTETNEDRFTHEMTMKLLEIVQSKFHILNDKMHNKKKIWADIATEMQNNGYLVSYGTKGADKCHQRWRNLEKIYHGHCRYIKSTGTGKKKPPRYFDEMHELIGEKHSSQPVNLLDSFDDFFTTSSDTHSSKIKSNEAIDNSEDLDTVDNASQCVKENIDYNVSPSIFKSVKKSVRLKIDNVSTVLKELHMQDIQNENERFEKFQALLVEQNDLRKRTLDQRDEFLTVIKKFINLEAHKKSKKRKYSSDSD